MDRFVVVYFNRALTRRSNPKVFAELLKYGFQPREEGWDPECFIMGHRCGEDEQCIQVSDADAIKAEVPDDDTGSLEDVAASSGSVTKRIRPARDPIVVWQAIFYLDVAASGKEFGDLFA